MTEPIGLSINLPVNRVMRALMHEHDVAIWRSASGRLSAWNNRCPHRGMRLSHGFVRGEALACLYHGWHYDAEGKCRYIPAHPELTPPDTIEVKSYSIEESSGILWLTTSGKAEPLALPDNLQPVRSITFDCHADAVVKSMSVSTLAGTDGDPLRIVPISQKPHALSLETANGEASVFILLQQCAGQTAAHILADNNWSADGLVEISRWSEETRRIAEKAVGELAAAEQGVE
ncbi:MAG: Rieske 2Fe-2S domain-containing protein [Rhizobiaceae bacterium]